MFEGFNLLEFVDHFKTDEDCKAYLADIKWQDGFRCRHCGHTAWIKTPDPFVRRCGRCKKKDSVTAGTLFHQCKFSLRKAFMIVFEMSCTKKSASSHVLADKFGMYQPVVWGFMQKVRKVMESSLQHPLTGEVEVDECVIGGPEQEKYGRGHETKKPVVMAIKHDDYGIHQCYARTIDNYSSTELKPFFQDHIAPSAKIKTDKWPGYVPLKKDYPSLQQEKSKPGKNFEHIHRQIMMLKNWLRGTHHSCQYLQGYLNEFCYRFNRLKWPKRMFHNLIERIVAHQPITHMELSLSWDP